MHGPTHVNRISFRNPALTPMLPMLSPLFVPRCSLARLPAAAHSTALVSVRRRALLALCCGLFFAFAPAPSGHAAEPVARPAPPLSFSLKDQFDTECTEATCSGKTALLMISDRKGGDFSRQWGPALGRELRQTPHPPEQWVSVATLTAVPSFMRGWVRKMFQKDTVNHTLLDWHGYFASTYALPADHCNILVFAPDGQLRFRAAVRELDPAVLSSIVAAIVNAAPMPATTATTVATATK